MEYIYVFNLVLKLETYQNKEGMFACVYVRGGALGTPDLNEELKNYNIMWDNWQTIKDG